MDHEDRRAIDDLFARLREVERQSPPRDTDAEGYIREQVTRQPAAPYYMAQTLIVQEQALEMAQQRIAELERQVAQQARPSGGGFLSGIFGGQRQPQPTMQPRGQTYGRSLWDQGYRQPPHGYPLRRGGSGFLAGAAQTAMGVAGGVLLGNAITGMFDGNEAETAEAPSDEPDTDTGIDDGGFDDFGGDEF